MFPHPSTAVFPMSPQQFDIVANVSRLRPQCSAGVRCMRPAIALRNLASCSPAQPARMESLRLAASAGSLQAPPLQAARMTCST